MSKLIEVGRGYLGQSEDGTKPENTDFVNEEFERELEGVGWRPGFAWCAIFVKLCVKVGDWKLWEKIKHLLSASVLTTFENFKKAGYTVYEEPQVGFICFMKNGNKWQGHEGLVTAVHADNYFSLLEGNASPIKGTRQGDCVAEKKWLNNRVPREKGLYVIGFINPYEKI